MKNYEVGIIVGVIALIGYFWWKNSDSEPSQQPIGNVKMVSTVTGPSRVAPECIAPGGVLLIPTCMISAKGCLVETP